MHTTYHKEEEIKTNKGPHRWSHHHWVLYPLVMTVGLQLIYPKCTTQKHQLNPRWNHLKRVNKNMFLVNTYLKLQFAFKNKNEWIYFHFAHKRSVNIYFFNRISVNKSSLCTFIWCKHHFYKKKILFHHTKECIHIFFLLNSINIFSLIQYNIGLKEGSTKSNCKQMTSNLCPYHPPVETIHDPNSSCSICLLLRHRTLLSSCPVVYACYWDMEHSFPPILFYKLVIET